jgi:NAD(P)-dependent dehydrogenase (short-subunit alcohol dehydrogenase family)
MRTAAPVELPGRTVVVTGASPGSLGFATAAALAEWGARVVVTTRTRTEEALAQLPGDVVGHPLDLAERASVDAFARWLTAHEDRLDVLVNNAGIHLDLRNAWKAPQLVDGHEIHWRTNYLGTVELTDRLLPILLATAARSGQARVVTVVSKLHARGRNEFLFKPIEPYHSWDAYGTSKLGLIHAMNELARRWARDNLRCYTLHPGSVYSHIADRGLEGHRVLSALRRAFAPVERRMLLSPATGAQTTLHCSTALDLPSGYYHDCAPAEPSAATNDVHAAQRLCAETQAWLAAPR